MSTVAAPVRVQTRGMLLSLIVCGVLPILAYFLTRGHLHGQIAPLAVSFAIPAVWTAVGMAWRRRLDPIGVLGVAGFGIRLLVALLLPAGGVLALKIGPLDVVEGLAGIVLLGSALIRRPALIEVIGLMARVSPGFAALRQRVAGWRSMTLLTALIGALLLADAVLHLALAVFLPTSTFVVVSNVKRYVLLGAALVLVLLRVRYQRRHPEVDGDVSGAEQQAERGDRRP